MLPILNLKNSEVGNLERARCVMVTEILFGHNQVIPVSPQLADLSQAVAVRAREDLRAPAHAQDVAVREAVGRQRGEDREVVRQAPPEVLELLPEPLRLLAGVARGLEPLLRRGYEGDQLRKAVRPFGEHEVHLGCGLPVSRPGDPCAVDDGKGDRRAEDVCCPGVLYDRLPPALFLEAEPHRQAQCGSSRDDAPRKGPPEHATLDLQQYSQPVLVVVHKHCSRQGLAKPLRRAYPECSSTLSQTLRS
mmetsp:Transcript_56710/g.165956  ORF Transcript_56710/g.165956 Transcript_56710/m.165956 type:complete len:248 (+) Transcript_56710:886-1629(+)